MPPPLPDVRPASLPPGEPPPGGPPQGVARSAASVGLAGLLTRILGLVRESAIAYYFGASPARDALAIALRIPNILRDLFAEGALSAAFVPNYTEYERNHGVPAALALANAVLGFLLLVVGALVLSFVFLARPWVLLFAGAGYASQPEQLELATRLTQLSGPFLLAISLAMVPMGILNVRGRFFWPAMTPALFNLVGILSCVFAQPFARFTGWDPITAVALGFTLGGTGQCLAMYPMVRRYGFRFRPSFDFSHPGLRRIIKLMAPGIIGLAAVQLTNIIDMQYASRWEGAASHVEYSFRLILFPIGIVAMALATATLAAASRHVADQDHEGLRRTVSQSVVLLCFLSLPASAAFIVLREPLAQFFYMQGQFGAVDATRTGWMLALFATGLMGFSYPRVIIPIFYALGDTLRPLLLTLLTILLKWGMVIALLPVMVLAPAWLFGKAEPYYALPLASAVAGNAEAVLLLWLLRRKMGPLTSGTGRAVLRIALATTVSAVAGWGVLALLPDTWAAPGKLLQTVKLALSGGVMVVAYVLAASLLGVEEMKSLLRKLKEGPPRRPGGPPRAPPATPQETGASV